MEKRKYRLFKTISNVLKAKHYLKPELLKKYLSTWKMLYLLANVVDR